MDSNESVDMGGAHEDLDTSIETNREYTETPAKPAYRTVEIDYENMTKLVGYADEMACMIQLLLSDVGEEPTSDQVMANGLINRYRVFRGDADADHGERKAPTLQEVSESEPT